jgi:hypothetical protein
MKMILLLGLIFLIGCGRREGVLQSDTATMWDKSGQAYLISHWTGNTFLVQRVDGADRMECKK